MKNLLIEPLEARIAPATLSITAVNPGGVNEGDATGGTSVFKVTLSDDAPGRTDLITVDYATLDGTATLADGDYSQLSGTLVFAAGETEKLINVAITGDLKPEPNETFSVALSGSTNATLGTSEAVGTILDDDVAPELRVSDVTISEGNSGQKEAVFTVTFTGKAPDAFSVNYATANGTATGTPAGAAGGDYQSTSGTLNFASGERTKEVRVPIFGDAIFEGDETFFVNLTNPTGGVQLAKAQGTGTITNDEAVPRLSISNVTLAEGDAGTKLAAFTVKLSGAAQEPVTVKYRTVDGTATAGQDYTAVPEQTLTFAPGETEKTIEVPIIGDTTGEANETFQVRLSELTGGAKFVGADDLTTLDGTGTITNDDGGLSIGDVTVSEGTGGTKNAVFTVTRTPSPHGTTTFPVQVNLTTEDGTGDNAATVANGDYTATSGTIQFAEGELTKTISIPLGTDDRFEQSEQFIVRLSGAVNADISNAVGTATITNDDSFISVNNVSVIEGVGGGTGADKKEAIFTVTLSGARNVPVTVNYATRNGTATEADYEAATGAVTFQPGETTKTITVLVVGDGIREPNEQFFLDLTTEKAGTATGTGTIVTDEAPLITVDSPTVVEGDSGTRVLRYTVTFDGQVTQPVKVKLATANGTATTADNDYVAREETLTFAPGETTKFFDVQIIGDTRGEANETVLVNLSNVENATLATTQVTGTIQNDDAVLSIGDTRIVEGDSGTKQAVFTVTRAQGDLNTEVRVNYATSNGSATAGTDYEAASGTLIFAAGETTKQVSVPVLGDAVVEADETFFVTLSNAQNAGIVDGQGVGTIANDEAQLQVNDVSIVEGNAGTRTAVFTVTRTGATGQAITVDFATADGTATSSGDNADYVARSGTLNFGANETSKTVAVEIRGDLRGEVDESFSLNLTNSTNAVVADEQGSGTIVNDDTPALRIDDVRVAEGDTGSKVATFTVSLSDPSDKEVTVSFSTGDGTATLGDGDYAANNGTLTFAPGVQSQTIEVTLFGDTRDELDETFFVNLTGATNATIADAQGVGTIGNDEVSVSISNPTIQEGDSGTSEAVFVVTLSGQLTRAVTVNYGTQDGTATVADGDYLARNGTLTFAAGETSKEIRVPVLGDTKAEANEAFSVLLSGVQNATVVGSGSGTGTITNDDVVSITVDDLTIVEGDTGTKNALFTVRLSKPSATEVTVSYTTQDGTATAGQDYLASNGVLTFAAGQVEKTISVPVVGDTTAEPDESFSLQLSGATGAAIGDATAVGTIRDARTISIDDVRVAEGNAGAKNFTFTVRLDAPAEQEITVRYGTQDGTATVADGDYLASAGTLTFAAGEQTKEVTVTVNGDTKNELDENFVVFLTESTGATLAKDRAFGTIANDESVFSIVSGTNASTNVVEVTEGNPGTGEPATATFKVVRTSGTAAATIDYSTMLGTGVGAAGANDFTAKSGTLSFAAGETAKTITVPITRDLIKEGTENFTVKLSNARDAVVGEGQDTGTVNILDDDAAPTLSVADVQIVEGNTGTKQAIFTVKLSAANETAPVTVRVSTKDGTAVSTGDRPDYVGRTEALGTAETLTFAPGETTKTFTVLINGDVLDEADEEAFTVELSNAQGAAIERAVATGTITDNDATPALSFAGANNGDISIVEGADGTRTAVFTVKLSAASGREVTVNYSTADKTATSSGPNADFMAATGQTLTFAPGETEKTISVPIFGDGIFEANETFEVKLSGAVNATITDDTGVGTITNDEATPALAINNVSVVEGNDGTSVAVFTVSLSGSRQDPVTVRFASEDGTARDGVSDGRNPADYGAVGGTLTFAPGESSKTIEVPIYGDTFRESNETFTVRLSSAENATIVNAAGTGTINDDGDSGVGIYVDDAQIVEGDSGQRPLNFTVRLTGTSDTATTFSVSTINGTASTLGKDFVGLTDQQFTIPAGQTSVTVPVNVIGDTLWEGGNSENFFLKLSDLPASVIPVAGAVATGTIYADDMTFVNERTLQYIDVDGDIVTVKVSKGVLSLNQFTFEQTGSVGGRQLQRIDFANTGTLFDGVNLTITAQSQILPGASETTLGDGRVNVGYVRGALVQGPLLEFTQGVDFGRIRIAGDLGKIDAGDNLSDTAIRKLDVGSLGALGTTTGAPDTLSRTLSGVNGLTIGGDMLGSLSVLGGTFGKIGKVKIGGALQGGNAESSGQIAFTGKLGSATIGSIVGGSGANSGAIVGSPGHKSSVGKIAVLGEITGGSDTASGAIIAGKIGSVKMEALVGGSGAQSGAVTSRGTLGSVEIEAAPNDELLSGLVGGAGAGSGKIVAAGKIKTINVTGSLIGGSGNGSGSIETSGSIRSIGISGNVVGGNGQASASIQIEGSVGKLNIGGTSPETGSVKGGSGVNSALIQIGGNLNTATIRGDILGGTGNGTGGFDVSGTAKSFDLRG
ncbi:MAG TPA: Calx-beta domain-containing protein, partial [Chthoniobacteraceae bacterium]